jgi:LysR family transcriptional activator of mexEF-oprN operon
MNSVHARDLDLNLFRVLVAVADTGSVTAAAAQLYLTQSAASAALRRLKTAIGAAVVARHGRGVVLTERGAALVAAVRPHLDAMIKLALTPEPFDPLRSERTLRLGLADSGEEWLLPALLRHLDRTAPRLRLICTPIQFRSVAEALATRRVDIAVTVADALPPSVSRCTLMRASLVCLFDPRFTRLGARPTERAYLAKDHVIVSYSDDLRGVVEDFFGRERRVRCSVASFSGIGAIVDGSSLVATVPDFVADAILRQRPHLRKAPLPLPPNEGGELELLWPAALDADDACCFLRESIEHVVSGLKRA